MVPESTQAGEEYCTVNIVKVPGALNIVIVPGALNIDSAGGTCKIVVPQNMVIGSVESGKSSIFYAMVPTPDWSWGMFA